MNGYVDQGVYRRLSEDLAAHIALLSVRVGKLDLITPIDSFLDISYDPPTMLLSLYAHSRANEAVQESGSCALNLMTIEQQSLIARYSEPAQPLQGMLNGVEFTRDLNENALINGAISYFSLEVEEVHPAKTHEILLCKVVAAKMGVGNTPAVRFSRRYLHI